MSPKNSKSAKNSRSPRNPRNTASDRILRRLALLGYLGAQEGSTFGELAELFGVPVRTVVADVFALWVVNGRPGDDTLDYVDFGSGLPDDFDHTAPYDEDTVARTSVWLRDAQGLDRPIPLTTREIVAMTLGLHELATVAQKLPAEYSGVADAVASARTKLARSRPEVSGPVRTTTGSVAADLGTQAEHLAVVQTALRERRQVRISYLSAADVLTERVVDPAAVVGEAGTWMLHAWCHRAEAPRTFRIDRMKAVTLLDEASDAGHVRAAAGSDPEVRMAGEGAFEVEVDVLPSALWRVEDVPHEEIIETGTGVLTVRLSVADPTWFAGFLLRLGAAVLAVRPPAAAVSAADEASRALQAYEDLDLG